MIVQYCTQLDSAISDDICYIFPAPYRGRERKPRDNRGLNIYTVGTDQYIIFQSEIGKTSRFPM